VVLARAVHGEAVASRLRPCGQGGRVVRPEAASSEGVMSVDVGVWVEIDPMRAGCSEQGPSHDPDPGHDPGPVGTSHMRRRKGESRKKAAPKAQSGVEQAIVGGARALGDGSREVGGGQGGSPLPGDAKVSNLMWQGKRVDSLTPSARASHNAMASTRIDRTVVDRGLWRLGSSQPRDMSERPGWFPIESN